ncbi:MAG: DNA-processing protein DprA [Alphaproteobacteria bacterium]
MEGTLITKKDPAFPRALEHLDKIWVAGNKDLSEKARVAIIGSRVCKQKRYLDIAFNLARDLTARGLTVVSGGARGIDTAAHKGALKAETGQNVVVLGTGLKRPYPSQNKRLFLDIAYSKNGLILSQFNLQNRPRRDRFQKRNETIAALADVIVVVYAQRRSGTLNTVRHARRLATPVVALQGSPGCDQAISEGAIAAESSTQLLQHLLPLAHEEAYGCKVGFHFP